MKYFSASATVPFSSQSKKQTHSLQRVLLGEDLVISPACEMGGGGAPVQFQGEPIAKGSGMVLGNLAIVSQPWSKVGCMTVKSVGIVSRVCSWGWDNRTLL